MPFVTSSESSWNLHLFRDISYNGLYVSNEKMTEPMLTETENLLQNTVREFADQVLAPRAASYDESGEFPWDNFRGLAELGLLGLSIDENYEGSGGTNLQMTVVVEEIARGCAATSLIYIAHLSLCTQFIQMFGSHTQKKNFIPSMVRGEKIGAFALSEADSGSDAVSLRTTSTKTDSHYMLNGSKMFISNALEANTFVVLVTRDIALGTEGIDALIVEKNSKGMTTTPQHGKMGMRASSTAEVVFQNCSVPLKNLLGNEGKGFQQTMELLNSSRISIGAQCVGIAQAAYEASVEYIKQRVAFGKKLADFQGIQWMIADMATNIEAARLMVRRAATLRDKNMPFVTAASMAKLFASRVAMESADRAVQIHGGTGYFAPSPVERLFRDARVTEIYEGTSEIQKLIIARNILQSREKP